MSTIKSSSEHLTLNADGASKDIKFQANGVEKASISSAGAFTSTTIDATALTGALPAISAASLTNVPAANITGTLPAIDGSNLTGVGGNLKVITGVTDDNSYTNSTYGTQGTTGSGFTITTGADTNRIAVNLTYRSHTYDADGGKPMGFASVHFHSSMNSGEAPSGTAIVEELAYYGGYNYDGSTSRHDLFWNNTLCGIATVSPSTTYYIQLVTRKGQYNNYNYTHYIRGYLMEYSQ